MQKVVIIVAGGKGERMKSDLPKQFIGINGKPILMHTIKAFHRFDSSMLLIVVLPAAQIEFWQQLCTEYAFDVPHRVAAGGETRFYSVKNGLEYVDLPALVAIHDGVRPLVSKETIQRCFEQVAVSQAVIPVVDSVDSIRYVEGTVNYSVDRSHYKQVQTPQVFNGELIKKAYEQNYSPAFTDDASVVEALGTKICLVEGNRENIKITTAFDLEIAACLLKQA